MNTPNTRRYLFLIGAFVVFLGNFMPWVCYSGEAEICPDGFSLQLFAAGDFNLLRNGAFLILLLLVYVTLTVLRRDSFADDNLQTGMAAVAVLLLVTSFFLLQAGRGQYQLPTEETLGSTLGAGLPLIVVGCLLMFGMLLWEYWPQRAKRGAALEGELAR